MSNFDKFFYQQSRKLCNSYYLFSNKFLETCFSDLHDLNMALNYLTIKILSLYYVLDVILCLTCVFSKYLLLFIKKFVKIRNGLNLR